MANSFKLKVLTPYRKVFEDYVSGVILPGESGEFGILAGHTKYMARLAPGVLRYVQADQGYSLAVSGGFAEVCPEGVTVLADSLEQPCEIDEERASISKQKCLEALQHRANLSEREIEHLETRLTRSKNRLKVARLK